MIEVNYNPDVLDAIANLSNDEVFTPPKLVNEMLDILPQELFESKTTTFLDPVCKSGVFLREIAKRLMKGLEKEIPDVQERANHIFKNQLFGIAITELTSLLSRRTVYGSKKANGKYSFCTEFENEQGNIIFDNVQHTWQNGKCTFCRANQEVYDRADGLETYAYQFIHTDEPEKIFNMKFDVIIGNPPYQLSDGGFGTSAKPIYQLFVQQAKKLCPRYLTMVIPARWYSGGKGLNGFRAEMLADDRIREIHDFPDATQVFPGVQIKGGVCYFLWKRDEPGLCKVSSYAKDEKVSEMERPLLEEGADTFIRYNEAISILKKVQKKEEPSIREQISSSKPFGLRTFFKGKNKKFKGAIKLYQNGGVGYVKKEELTKGLEYLPHWKVMLPRAGSGSDSFPHPILGQPFVAEPNSACTETYLIAGCYDNEQEAENLVSYLKTRVLRFLVLLNKPAQHATAKVYQFVPLQDFSEPWTDEKLYKKYGLTQEEIDFTESMIRPME